MKSSERDAPLPRQRLSPSFERLRQNHQWRKEVALAQRETGLRLSLPVSTAVPHAPGSIIWRKPLHAKMGS